MVSVWRGNVGLDPDRRDDVVLAKASYRETARAWFNPSLQPYHYFCVTAIRATSII